MEIVALIALCALSFRLGMGYCKSRLTLKPEWDEGLWSHRAAQVLIADLAEFLLSIEPDVTLSLRRNELLDRAAYRLDPDAFRERWMSRSSTEEKEDTKKRETNVRAKVLKIVEYAKTLAAKHI